MKNDLCVAAVYTTYHPDRGFRQRIEDVIANCAVTIVCDNTPGGHDFSSEDLLGVTLLQDGSNKGLGAALNAGIEEALIRGCNAVVLFDQDSSPSDEFIQALLNGLSAAGPRSIVGPQLIDDHHSHEICVSDLVKISPEFKEVTCIATSGMCFRLDFICKDDRFTEDFFLDFVDFDWCWRMRYQGWRILRLTTLKMPHRLGLAQRKFFGFTYHVPTPFRHYFQFRDTLKLIGIYYVPKYSRVRLAAVLLPKLIVYPFLLDKGLERLMWMLRGIRDAFYGVRGIGAADRKLQAAFSDSP